MEVGRFSTYENHEPDLEVLDYNDLERRFTEFCVVEGIEDDVWFHDVWGEEESETLGNLLSFAAQNDVDRDYFLSYMGVGDRAYEFLDLDPDQELE